MFKATFGECQIELIQGNIVSQNVDAIVNAANSRLAGGSGVDGAIHNAAGTSVMLETARIYPEGCPIGSAVSSIAGNLSADYIFHAVGPIWKGGQEQESEKLKAAYKTCLELAAEHRCKSIAFPAISTGAYNYPLDLAAEIAIETTVTFLIEQERPKLIRFVLFNEGTYSAFLQKLENKITH